MFRSEFDIPSIPAAAENSQAAISPGSEASEASIQEIALLSIDLLDWLHREEGEPSLSLEEAASSLEDSIIRAPRERSGEDEGESHSEKGARHVSFPLPSDRDLRIAREAQSRIAPAHSA